MDARPTVLLMQGLGERLRARARELGVADAEVARRAGLTPTRYANYVSDRHEPDLGTFARLCAALYTSADDLLGIARPAPTNGDGGPAPAVSGLDPAAEAALALVTEALSMRAARLGQGATAPASRFGPKSRK